MAVNLQRCSYFLPHHYFTTILLFPTILPKKKAEQYKAAEQGSARHENNFQLIQSTEELTTSALAEQNRSLWLLLAQSGNWIVHRHASAG